VPWYTAILVRGEYVAGEGGPPKRGDMLYRLVEAADAESAYERALAVGAGATESYTDESGAAATFRFLGLAGLVELPGPPGDGAEVYSQFVPTPPTPLLLAKDELAVFAAAADVDDEDVWADGEGPVDTSADVQTETPGEPEESEPFDDSGAAPLKPR
jgi:hypothetical protein